MLEIAADKFHHFKGHCPPAGAFLLFVTENDLVVFDPDYPAIADRDFEDIGCQIFQAAFTAADGLAVDIPVKFPDDRVDLIVKAGFYDFITELCFKDL